MIDLRERIDFQVHAQKQKRTKTDVLYLFVIALVCFHVGAAAGFYVARMGTIAESRLSSDVAERLRLRTQNNRLQRELNEKR